MTDPASHGFETEPDQVARGPVLLALVIVVVTTVLVSLWALFLLRSRLKDYRPSREFPERSLGPPHEVAQIEQSRFEDVLPRTDTAQQRERDSYRWLNKDKRIVGIPVQRAMDLMLKQEEKR